MIDTCDAYLARGGHLLIKVFEGSGRLIDCIGKVATVTKFASSLFFFFLFFFSILKVALTTGLRSQLTELKRLDGLMKPRFNGGVVRVKPKASRSESAELYYLGLDHVPARQ